MANDKKHWFETLPGILAGIAAVIGAIASLYVAMDGKHEIKSGLEPQPTPIAEQKTNNSTSPSIPLNQALPLDTPQSRQPLPAPINISSTWHELYPNPGNVSQTIQEGEIFNFTIQGIIQGLHFQTSGSGTIKGRYMQSTYQSTIPSTGSCAGAVSADAMQIKLTCDDSVTGQYETAWVRE